MTPTHRLLRVVATLSCLAALAACGGGNEVAPTPDPAANRAPVASAGAIQAAVAGSVVTLDGSASTDPDGDSLRYTWSLVAPAGSTATLGDGSTARPTLTPDQPGTYVATLTVSDGRGGSASSTVTVTVAAATPPAIALDASEPLSDTVKLSLTGTVAGAVTWYVDLRLIGSGNAADANAIAWNTAGVTNGEHQVLARIQPLSGGATELRRTVSVSNSTVSLSAGVSGITGTINLDVRATSAYGVTAVSATFDGADAGTLTQPNACSRSCSGASDIYRFTVDAARVGSGNHTMVVTATDGAGSARSVTVGVPVSNAPELSLTAPADGALVFGTLRLDGAYSSDKAGTVTVTASLGDVQILTGTASSFSTRYDLTGLAPGAYTLTVRATDSTGQVSQVQRDVRVASTGALAYTPVFTLPPSARLLTVEGAQALYAVGDGSVRLRHLVDGSEVVLAGAASIQYASGWQLDAGRVVAYGKGTDCVLYCVYLWSASGSVANLTNANPYSRASNIGGGWAYDLHPVLRGDHVIWVNDKAADTAVATSATGRYTLHQISTNGYTRIGVPTGVNYVGNNEYDFNVSGGVVDFWFWGQTGGEGTASQFDIFRWRSDTGAATRVTPGGSRHIYPQVDATRVAWQQSPVGGTADNTYALRAGGLSGAATTLADQATSFRLRDGVLAWVETPTPTSRALKASTDGATRTVSVLGTATLLANGGGRVAYSEAGKTYTWNASQGLSTLRVESAPGQVFIAGGALVFTLGPSVYRVPLD